MHVTHPPRKARTTLHHALSATTGDWEVAPPEAAAASDEQIRTAALAGINPALAAGGLIVLQVNGESVGVAARSVTKVTVEIVPTLDLTPGLASAAAAEMAR